MKASASGISFVAPPELPAATAWLFPEYDFAAIDPETCADVIIERILERGSWDELRWLFARYGEPRVSEWVRVHGFRLLSKRSFALWRLALDMQNYVAPGWAREAKEMEVY
jgi:hypothetical protein